MAAKFEVIDRARIVGLDTIKTELHEQSWLSGILEVHGPVMGATKPELWTGSISLANRLKGGELTARDIADLLELTARCYLPASQGAYERCIDGRSETGYDDNVAELYGRILGPQSPGASVVSAICLGLCRVKDRDNPNVLDDFNVISTMHRPYLLGDHTDETHTESLDGCGAVAGVTKHMTTILEDSKAVGSISHFLLGDSFSEQAYDSTLKSVNKLMALKTPYFKGKQVIEDTLLAADRQAVPILGGAHREIFVGINLVPEETFHRDHFNTLSDGKTQVFNYDFWRTIEEAKQLAQGDKELFTAYLHNRTALAVAALMSLTDGTQQLFIRRSRQQTDGPVAMLYKQ